MNNSGTGFFVALEGPDGSGKTTQAVRLAQRLRTAGHQVLTCRDPGGTPEGDKIRSLLLDRSALSPTMTTEMLLYMASRAQLVEQVVKPALAAGSVVISDRFLLSNMVYQGYAGGLSTSQILEVGRIATGELLPDLTILIDVVPEIARQRIGAPRDRIEDRPEEFRRKVRDGYLALLSAYPSPSVIVDGSKPMDEVESAIYREVAHVLGNRSWA